MVNLRQSLIVPPHGMAHHRFVRPRWCKRLPSIFLLVLALAVWLAAGLPAGRCLAARVPVVLVIHSYDPENLASEPEDKGLVAGLARHGYIDGRTVDIRRFYMDTKRRYTSPEQIRARGREALKLVAAMQPDVVVTMDDNAIRTVMMPLVDTEIPVVFSGMNNQPEFYNRAREFMRSRSQPGHNVTGVHERLYIDKSLQLMKEIVPGLRRVVFIVDDSPTGYAIKRQIQEELFANETDILYSIWQAGSFAQYRRFILRINSDPEIGAYYPVAVRLPAADGSMVTGEDLFRWTLRHGRKPGMAVNYVVSKMGILGGVSVNFVSMGGQVADRVARVLQGTPAGEISIEDTSDYAIVFNMARARQLGIAIPTDLLAAADQVFETMLPGTMLKRLHVLIIHSYGKGIGSGAVLERGILDELKKNGFFENRNISISRFYMETRQRYTTPEQIRVQGREALGAVKCLAPDVVVILDDPAVAEVLPSLVDGDTPVLFGGISVRPEIYNRARPFMISREKPGHNVTGVTEEVDYVRTLETAHEVVPAARRLVVVTSDTEPWLQMMSEEFVREVKLCTRECPITSIGVRHVATFAELQTLIRRLDADPAVDMIAVTGPLGLRNADGSVRPLADTLTWLFANQTKPGFTFFTDWVRYGYLVSAGIDLVASGHQLGRQLVRVLRGDDAGEIPVEKPAESYIAINLARARQLGIRVPVDILEAARLVYDRMEPERAR
ncbi:ABC transporter substrate-binding protein [Thermodesulfobacteriota bacterium B35]